MAQEIEIEYKMLLTKTEFELLLSNIPFPKEGEKQINHYFDTKCFSLQKKLCALRIREKDNSYQLTLKEPNTIGLLETHDTLSKKDALSWLDGNIIEQKHVGKQLNTLDVLSENLLYYGSLTTVRREINDQNVIFVLDYNTFNGYSDYEFELEAPNENIGSKTFKNILTEHSIIIKDTPNKIQRFFSTLPKYPF